MGLRFWFGTSEGHRQQRCLEARFADDRPTRYVLAIPGSPKTLEPSILIYFTLPFLFISLPITYREEHAPLSFSFVSQLEQGHTATLISTRFIPTRSQTLTSTVERQFVEKRQTKAQQNARDASPNLRPPFPDLHWKRSEGPRLVS